MGKFKKFAAKGCNGGFGLEGHDEELEYLYM